MFDRRTHWQTVYRKISASDVSWYQEEPKLSLALIRRCKLRGDEPIIDVGGGASVLVDYLCRAGFTNLSVQETGIHVRPFPQKDQRAVTGPK